MNRYFRPQRKPDEASHLLGEGNIHFLFTLVGLVGILNAF